MHIFSDLSFPSPPLTPKIEDFSVTEIGLSPPPSPDYASEYDNFLGKSHLLWFSPLAGIQ